MKLTAVIAAVLVAVPCFADQPAAPVEAKAEAKPPAEVKPPAPRVNVAPPPLTICFIAACDWKISKDVATCLKPKCPTNYLYRAVDWNVDSGGAPFKFVMGACCPK